MRHSAKLLTALALATTCGIATHQASAQTYSSGSSSLAYSTVTTAVLTTTAASPLIDEVAYTSTGYEQYNGFNPAYTVADYYGAAQGTTYASATFAETAGMYSITATQTGYSSSSLNNYIYDGTFTPGTGANDDQSALTNVASDYFGVRTTGSTYTEILPAGTGAGGTGTIVDSDYYVPGTSGKVTNGTDTVVVSELNAIIVPQGTPAGASLTTTDTGTGVIGTDTNLASLSIFGLDSTWDGDLTATLTHDGVTVSIFDNPGASTANYGLGNWGLFTNTTNVAGTTKTTNVYTFANTGTDLTAISGDTTVAAGTYALSNSGTANGGQNDFATTFAAFNGLSESGAWTLNIANANYGDISYFSGFGINMMVAPTPESSTLVSMLVTLSLMTLLVWKARSNRLQVTALKGENNE